MCEVFADGEGLQKLIDVVRWRGSELRLDWPVSSRANRRRDWDLGGESKEQGTVCVMG